MIVLKADSELKMTFERLIKTMHANVNWTGLFVALDNYLILQGEVPQKDLSNLHLHA